MILIHLKEQSLREKIRPFRREKRRMLQYAKGSSAYNGHLMTVPNYEDLGKKRGNLGSGFEVLKVGSPMQSRD